MINTLKMASNNINVSNEPGQINIRPLIIGIFQKIEYTIKKGDVDYLKKLITILYRAADKASLSDFYDDESNPIRETHLITLACKYNQQQVLDFLLHKSNILCYLPDQGPIVEKAYVKALCETMRSLNTHMLETLYDYWSGDIHWLGHIKNSNTGTVLQTLKQLNKLLVTARDECKEHLEQNKQISIDVNCLIRFNLFQINLYSELSKLITNRTQQTNSSTRINDVESIRSVLLTALNIYDEYSSKILDHILEQCDQGLCFLCYFNCDLYYRKLDLNIALLIANNLHLLKLRLTLPGDAYQEIECQIYYFLYLMKDNWKFYLPENIPKFGTLTHDRHNMQAMGNSMQYYSNGVVVFFEWKEYKRHLKKFKEILENTDIVSNLRKVGTELPDREINTLVLKPYDSLRDDYSLKKIWQYLDQVSCLDLNQNKMDNVLIIQRIIQMTGEYLKGTEETFHLSQTSLALLQIEIPKRTYVDLSKLRVDFSKAKYGKLIKRIDLELNENEVFMKTANDLEKIKEVVKEVIITYKPSLENHLLEMGLRLINKAFTYMPKEVMSYRDEIFNYYSKISNNDEFEQFLKDEEDYVSRHSWLTKNLFRKIAFLEYNLRKLREKIIKCRNEIKVLLMKNILKYSKAILDTIVMIENHNKTWEVIIQDIANIRNIGNTQTSVIVRITFQNYPNTDCIKNIKKILKCNRNDQKALKKEILNKLDKVQDWTKEWREINAIIQFMVHQASTMENYKSKEIFRLYAKMHDTPNSTGIRHVRMLINRLTKYRIQYLRSNSGIGQTLQNPHNYEELRTLRKKMQEKLFITKNEMTFLKNNSKNICDCDANNICNHRKIFQKLYNNTMINEKEYETTKSMNINEKCRKIIKNLANGNARDNNILECLVNRMNLLNSVLEGEKDIEKLILRYKHDDTFRNMMDMIVSDLMNIYTDDKRLSDLLNLSYTKLLAEYPLRNILNHGNPLLDIYSVTLDANDYPKALINFALNVAEDASHLYDLFKLYEDGVDLADVKADASTKLKDDQKVLVDNFKKCGKWNIYIKLLPSKPVTTSTT